MSPLMAIKSIYLIALLNEILDANIKIYYQQFLFLNSSNLNLFKNDKRDDHFYV